jgi:hypothetical protein
MTKLSDIFGWKAGEFTDKLCPDCKRCKLQRMHSEAGDIMLECDMCYYTEHGDHEERKKGIEEGIRRHLEKRKAEGWK